MNFAQVAEFRKLYIEMFSCEPEDYIERLKEVFIWRCAMGGLYLVVALKPVRRVGRYRKAIALRSLRAIENLTR
jgi:hypothetical protein